MAVRTTAEHGTLWHSNAREDRPRWYPSPRSRGGASSLRPSRSATRPARGLVIAVARVAGIGSDAILSGKLTEAGVCIIGGATFLDREAIGLDHRRVRPACRSPLKIGFKAGTVRPHSHLIPIADRPLPSGGEPRESTGGHRGWVGWQDASRGKRRRRLLRRSVRTIGSIAGNTSRAYFAAGAPDNES